MGKLTVAQIRALKEPGRYSDGDGLILEFTRPGRAYWFVRVQHNGRRRDIGLGSVDEITLAKARDKAHEARKALAKGIDPTIERQKAKLKIPTFREAAKLVHDEHKAAWKNGKHQDQWIYARLPVWANRSAGDGQSLWPMRYVRMLDMANDSGKFHTRVELEGDESAWPVGGNRFASADGEWVPLYEGKMVQAFDHRASDIVLAEANVFRSGQGADLTDDDHRDPARQPTPRYWVRATDTGWDAQTDWCLSLKDVTSVTNARTTITAIIPRFGAGHTLPVLFPAKDASAKSYVEAAPLVIANLNSVVLDYLARQKVHGNYLAWYLVEQLPIIPPAAYVRMFGPKSAADIVREAVLELSYTAHDLAPFARDMGHVDANGDVLPPLAWDEDRRLHLRAKLDALYFILYGVFDPGHPAQSRDDIRYVYSTFPIVEREETAKWGRYRSRDLALAWVSALTAGQPDADMKP